MKTKLRWVSWRMASALLALPLLSMTVPVFAAAPPASVSIVAPPMASGSTPITIAVPSTAAASSLTAAQSQQAITVANAYATTASNGTITVSATVLAQQGLSSAQVQWVESSMQTFDQGVENGTVNPNPITNTPANDLSGSTSMSSGISPMSTGGLSYSWFVSSTPFYYILSRWYGSRDIFNSVATIDLVNALTQISNGVTLAGGLLSFLPGPDAVSILSFFVSVGLMLIINACISLNGGFGVNWDMAFGAIPLQISSNNPF